MLIGDHLSLIISRQIEPSKNTKNIKEITNKIPLGWKMGVVKRTIGGDVG